MKTKELNENILELVLQILDENHSVKEKKIPNVKTNQIEMTCPVCGDSKKNHSKKRGILYLDSFKYYCWNGDCTAKYWSIFKFLNFFNKKISNIEQIIHISDIVKNSKLQRTHTKLVDSSEYFEYLYNNSVTHFELKKFYGLQDIDTCKWGKEFLKSRALIRFRENFLFKTNKFGNREVWVLNKIDENNTIVGLQIKNIDFSVKYTTKNFQTLNEEMGKTLSNTDPYFLEKCNNFSTIFNIFNVDIENTLTVFEGPIDAMFLKNSIATAGASKLKDFFDDLDNVRFFFDNDKTGKTNSISKIKNGKRSFMWKKFFTENNYNKTDIKDLNDLVLYVVNNIELKESLKKINDNFSSSKYDIYHV